jgi:hypothetical protein
MKTNKLVRVGLVALMALAFLNVNALAQTSPQPPAAKMMKVTVVGKIVYKKSIGRYIVQEKPLEASIIVNQNPGVLEKYAKSGKRVTIQGRRTFGRDNLIIEKINGKNYEGVQK